MFQILGKSTKTLNETHKRILMERFQSWKKKYLRKEEITQLGLSFNISEETIQNWFTYAQEMKSANGTLSKRE